MTVTLQQLLLCWTLGIKCQNTEILLTLIMIFFIIIIITTIIIVIDVKDVSQSFIFPYC